jgi:hypothetical protein
MSVVLSPPNKKLRIDEVWLFVSMDETGEGVCAANLMAGALIPLIAADEERMKSLIPVAQEIASESGKQIKLIKLSQRTEVMTLLPDGGAVQ